MSAYIDNMMPSIISKNWPYQRACHLIADSLDELHLFASSIGLRRRWFQNHSIPHYDLTESKRALAIKLGAIPLGTKEYVVKMRSVRLNNVRTTRQE